MADSLPNGAAPPVTPQGNSVAATLDVIPPSSPSEAATLGPPSAVEMPNTLTHFPEGAATVEPVLPTSLPGYEILEEMGRGGMGVVYKARQCHLNRLVALKMILAGAFASGDQRVRFLAEAETIAQLRHPYIVQVYDFNQYQGNPYFALEYLEGGTLEKKLAGTPLPPRDAALIVKKLAEAVQSAHDKGIIHRDLKPANVLLDKQGEPKLTDFGLAKHSSSNLTASGAILGTPSYMAPEQAGGKTKEITVRTDVYSLGAILYECVTGRPPFRAHAPFDTMVLVLERDPAAPRQLQPHLPRDLETICLTCLRKEPAKRYDSAAALAADLQRFLAGEPILARRTSRVERTWRWCKRNPVVAGLAAAVAVLLLAGTVVSSALAVQSSHRADDAVREKDRADAKTAETVREKDRADAQATEARKQEAEAKAQEAKARAHFQRRQEGLERLLMNLDGRLARYGSDISSVRLEFLQEFLKLGQELMEDNQKDPSARLQMAQLHRRIGEVWFEDNNTQAEKSYSTALGLLEKLIAEYPKEVAYRDELVYTLARHARALRGLGRSKEAEQVFTRAATVSSELAAAYPDKDAHLLRAAYYRFELGDMLESNLEREKAAAAYRQALAEQERALQKWPRSAEFLTLSRIADSLGTLLAKKNPADGKPFLEKRLAACREAKQREPSGNAGQRLQQCYFDLGETYMEQGWHEALRDLSLAYGKDFPDDPDQTYNAACLMANACAAAKKAEKTPGPLTESYARQAMDLLRKAAALGYRDRVHMDRDTDLDPLRQRADYQAYCAELDKRYPSPPLTPARQLQLLEQEVQEAQTKYRRAPRTTVAERSRSERKRPSLPTFVDKYLAFAEKYRQSPEAITALLWVMENTARSRNQTAIAKQREKALALLERDHLQKPEFLQVCQKLGEDPTVDCQSLLRAAVAKHSERDIRAAAGLVLADALAKEAENKYDSEQQRAAELAYQAEQQLEQLLKDYPEVVVGSVTMRETAQEKLFQLRNLSVGRAAPEITGEDLEGKAFKLSDYRGKVVVIDFWANWCGWCREMYPHSRHMVESLKDKPFALLGVNNDDNLSEVKKVVDREKLSWRSWWDGNERIRKQYQISSWPTIYVLDAKGVIRYKGLRGDKLEKAVLSLLKEMETAKKPSS